jgi:hypothetical protein
MSARFHDLARASLPQYAADAAHDNTVTSALTDRTGARERSAEVTSSKAVGSDTDWTGPWTLVIAVVALAQPWAISVYRSLFRRRRVKEIPSGRMEIGYSFPFGSNICLKGAIYSENSPSLVKSMAVEVRNIVTSSTRMLKMHLSRDPELKFSGNVLSVSAQLAEPILVEKDGVGQFYVTFIDFDDFGHLEDIGRRILPLWNAYRDANFDPAGLGNRPTEPLLAALFDQQLQNKFRLLFNAFCATPEIIPLVSEVESLYHWPPGDYCVTLSFLIEGEKRQFPTSWPITIMDKEQMDLKTNLPLIMRNLCGFNDPTLARFVYPEYKDLNPPPPPASDRAVPRAAG